MVELYSLRANTEQLNLLETYFENPLIHLHCIGISLPDAELPSLLGRFLRNSDVVWSNRSSPAVLRPQPGVTPVDRKLQIRIGKILICI